MACTCWSARDPGRAHSRAPQLRPRIPGPAGCGARGGRAAVLDSPRAQGFKIAVIWRGGGGHDLRHLVASYNGEGNGMRVHLPEQPFQSLWSAPGDPAVPSVHADSFATSIMLARRPELVRADRMPGPSRQPGWSDPGLDFGTYSDSGVIGDARHASREMGIHLWQDSVDWLAQFIAEAAAVNGRG
ncbi:MAG TPA: hypothetical protein DHU96_00120 [Actinobacteria bacterium]|nr:hypothetical protein [Actinomycetota bacterium]